MAQYIPFYHAWSALGDSELLLAEARCFLFVTKDNIDFDDFCPKIDQTVNVGHNCYRETVLQRLQRFAICN